MRKKRRKRKLGDKADKQRSLLALALPLLAIAPEFDTLVHEDHTQV
ncbi:MAG: hypothetical protein SAJ37_00560 [Oscillatoria sp. PMC 1068.18]|nr:hypothetical protein [Oscillatoria sp. PMC 1076.18]MEC4987213.1 hypothetical protein [Oscillatoria sp. PMC 1068.18]